MENNKIELSDGTVLLDLTSDTVTPGKLVYGTTAHDQSGAQITGTGLYAASDTDGGDALNAKEVNGHTVASDVPANAVFTDTVTTVTTSGTGNAVTDITASNGALTVTKGSTFLTSHQDISGKVNKSGDTMTGDLHIRGNYVSNQTYSTTQYSSQFRLDDSQGTNIGMVRTIHYSGGNEITEIFARRNVNNTDIYNGIQFVIDANGNKSAQMSTNITNTGTLTYAPSNGVTYVTGATGSGAGLYVKKRALNVANYNPAVVLQTKTGGSWAIHNYDDDKLQFAFVTKANIDSSTNTAQVYSIDTNGDYSGKAANVTGTVAVANGGTGATSAAAARTNLGAVNKAGDTMTADLTLERTTTIANNTPAALRFKTIQSDNNVTSTAYIAVYDDHDANTYGTNMVVQSSGNVIIGGGESPSTIYTNLYKDTTSENLVLTADGVIDIYVNTNTYANRVKVQINSSGNFTGKAANVTGTVAITNGGTGATTADGARTALGIPNSLQSKNSGNTAASLITIAGGSTATGSFDVTVTGKMAVALGGYYLDNGASGTGGTNATTCYLYGIYVADNTLYYRIRNTASSQAKVRLTAYVFYRPKYSDE